MSPDVVSYAVGDAVATIAMDRPQTRNALSGELLDALIAAFARAREDPASPAGTRPARASPRCSGPSGRSASR